MLLKLRLKLFSSSDRINKDDDFLEFLIQLYHDLNNGDYIEIIKKNPNTRESLYLLGEEIKNPQDYYENWKRTLLKGLHLIKALMPSEYHLRPANLGFFQSILNELQKPDEENSLIPGGQGAIIEVATGGGKTAMAASLIAAMPKNLNEIKPFLPGRKITYDFSTSDSDFKGDNERSYGGDVVVTVAPSFSRNLPTYFSGLIIMDESHLIQNRSDLRSKLDQVGANSSVIKFSATPYPLTIEEPPEDSGYRPFYTDTTVFYGKEDKMPFEKKVI